jgi:hypothetical protein
MSFADSASNSPSHDAVDLLFATIYYEYLLEHGLPAVLPNFLIECPTCGSVCSRSTDGIHQCHFCGELWAAKAEWGSVLAWPARGAA